MGEGESGGEGSGRKRAEEGWRESKICIEYTCSFTRCGKLGRGREEGRWENRERGRVGDGVVGGAGMEGE